MGYLGATDQCPDRVAKTKKAICDTVSQVSPFFATPRCVLGRQLRLTPNYLGYVGMA